MKNIITAIIVLIYCFSIDSHNVQANAPNIHHQSSTLVQPKFIALSEKVTLDGFLVPKKIQPIFLLEELPVKKIHVTDGASVNKNDCLLSYDTAWLQQKRETIEQQLQMLKKQPISVDVKQKNNWRHKFFQFFHRPNKELELVKQEWEIWQAQTKTVQIAQLQAELDRLAIIEQQAVVRAPFSGQIMFPTNSAEKMGSTNKKTPIFSVVDTLHMSGCFYANIYQLSLLHTGDAIQMQWNGTMHQYTGTITNVHSIPKEGTQQYEIDVDFLQPAKARPELRAGMIGTGIVLVHTHQNACTLPRKCVLLENNQTFVYTVKNNHIEKTPIKIGITTDCLVEITDGIQPDEWVLCDPTGQISEGQISP